MVFLCCKHSEVFFFEIIVKIGDKMSKEKESKQISKSKAKKDQPKKSMWVRFRIFLHGVRSEFSKVHWTSGKDLVRYSIATITLIIFFAIFFYVLDIIFALIQSLF